jgi:hypothetical protein
MYSEILWWNTLKDGMYFYGNYTLLGGRRRERKVQKHLKTLTPLSPLISQLFRNITFPSVVTLFYFKNALHGLLNVTLHTANTICKIITMHYSLQTVQHIYNSRHHLWLYPHSYERSKILYNHF